MKMNKRDDDISLEPLLLLTLALLIGAAFHQGVFKELMALAGAMAALCLVHMALIGRVETIARMLTRAVGKRPPSETLVPETVEETVQSFQLEEATEPSNPRTWPTLVQLACQSPEELVEDARELALFTSGKCLTGSAPLSTPVSRF